MHINAEFEGMCIKSEEEILGIASSIWAEDHPVIDSDCMTGNNYFVSGEILTAFSDRYKERYSLTDKEIEVICEELAKKQYPTRDSNVMQKLNDFASELFAIGWKLSDIQNDFDLSDAEFEFICEVLYELQAEQNEERKTSRDV